ncbi:MAG: DNA/RNA nuclease SfsA [Spirochaetia bacterium]|nr:DNA/RNA nuclease SfsA [Spirochaetia bacterium]
MSRSFEIFHNHREALFVRRPNRFLIIAADPETGEELACHCPNPGSIAEFTIPGTRLILERRPEGGKTAWIAAAVRYEGRCLVGEEGRLLKGSGEAPVGRDKAAMSREHVIVPLYSARANEAAKILLLPRLFPQARTIQPEYVIDGSRFDFFIEDSDGSHHLIEIKACSLVEYGIAMFPDAPSLRALKHLEELSELSRKGYTTHVVFMIMHGNPERFIPNLHSHPAFAAALGRRAGQVENRAFALKVDESGLASLADSEVPIDLSHTKLAESDSGSYMMLLQLERRAEIVVGSLGAIVFEPGWYVYCGSAKKGLSKRVARHQRKIGKARHWHIDYLVPHASSIKALPILSYENLECELAAALGVIGGSDALGDLNCRGAIGSSDGPRATASLGGKAVLRFGSTDCGCPSHLFHFDTDPMKNRAFLDILFLFRHRISLGLENKER